MAIDIGELRGILSLKDTFSPALEEANKGLDKFSESFKAVGAVAAMGVGAISAATAAVVALGMHGTEVSEVSAGFEVLTQRAGETADVMLGALRSGVLGTVSDLELMRLGNIALGSGAIKTAADMETLAAGAKLLGDRAVVPTTEAFAMLSKAMAKGTTKGLESLSMFVDTKDAVGDYKDEMEDAGGKTDTFGKKAATSKAVMEALQKEVEANGEAQRTFADNIDAAKVTVQNWIDNLGKAIAESAGLKAGMAAFGASMDAAFGDKQRSSVETMVEYVNRFAVGLTYAGQTAVVMATIAVGAFYVVETAISAVITGFLGIATGIAGTISKFSELASEIPGVGKSYEGVAAKFEEAKGELAGLTEGMAENTRKSFDAAAGNNELVSGLGKSYEALGKSREAIRSAGNALDEVKPRQDDFNKRGQEMADRSDQNTKAIAASYQKLKDELDLFGRAGLDKTLTLIDQEHDARVRSIEDLKGISNAERNDQIEAEGELYKRKIAAAYAGGDELVRAQQQIQDEIALMQTTGIENSLLALDQQQAAEIEKLGVYKEYQRAYYDEQVKLVGEKFDAMREKATGYYADIILQAAAAGFQTRAEQQATADLALDTYNRMLESGKYTDEELKRAHDAYTKAVMDMDGKRVMGALAGFELIAGSASSVLRDIFGKSKKAAIAAAIIDTIAAIVKTMSAYPFPWSLAPAAAAAAAGYKEVDKIRSSDAGFRTGTPDTAFLDFGPGSMQMLHGPEAVVTKAQGESLSEMVRAAAEGGGSQGRSLQVVNNWELNANPLQTFEDRQELMEFNFKRADERERENLPRMLALGMA